MLCSVTLDAAYPVSGRDPFYFVRHAAASSSGLYRHRRIAATMPVP